MSTEQIEAEQSQGKKAKSFKLSGFQQSTFEVVSVAERHESFEPLAYELVPDMRPPADPMFDLFDDSQENRGEKTIGELFQEERGGASEPALASNETCHQEGSQTAVPFREEECSVPTWPAEASPVEAAVHDAGDGEERRACDEQGASTITDCP